MASTRTLRQGAFDSRIVSDAVLRFVRDCQAESNCVLGGGAALAGAWLHHRKSRDIDLFFSDRAEQRNLVQQLPEIARAASGRIELKRDAGTHVRAELNIAGASCEVDIVVDSVVPLEAPQIVDGVQLQSLLDLRANKLTCLLSRVEPRDLVDVLFLERAGFTPEDDLRFALQKDAGTDPAVLAWLLTQFRTTPLPEMLEPLTEQQLDQYRAELALRIKEIAQGGNLFTE